MSAPDDDPPHGFFIAHPDEPFEMHVGPHYFRDDDPFIAGMRARPVHANAGGAVHGGALASFADSALTAFGLNTLNRAAHWVVTITLNSEFIAPARVGDWLECHGRVTGRTRSLLFVRGEIRAGVQTVDLLGSAADHPGRPGGAA